MSQAISSITRGPRQSNMEMLRIIAMFMILVLHADFWSLGAPTISDFHRAFIPSTVRVFVEALAIVSVNVFVLISGWFTIKPSVKGFCNFIFQCLFFFIGIYAVMLMTGLADLSIKGLAICFFLTSKNWFIKAYIGLYILAPILNVFSEKASKKELGMFLVCFYTFQTIYGCSGAATYIASGYSTFSFIGLYLLAQYIKRYYTGDYKWGGVFLATVLLNTSIFMAGVLLGIEQLTWSIFNYVNPLVIIGAVALLKTFAGIKAKHNRFINWVAASSFAVFLVHCNPNIGTPYFKPFMQQIYNDYSGIVCFAAFTFVCIAIYLISILLDQPRKWIWKIISRKMFS